MDRSGLAMYSNKVICLQRDSHSILVAEFSCLQMTQASLRRIRMCPIHLPFKFWRNSVCAFLYELTHTEKSQAKFQETNQFEIENAYNKTLNSTTKESCLQISGLFFIAIYLRIKNCMQICKNHMKKKKLSATSETCAGIQSKKGNSTRSH